VVPLARVATTAAELASRFGPPDLVEVERQESGIEVLHPPQYDRLAHDLPLGTVHVYFLKHDLFVELKDGRVRRATAMYQHNREHAASLAEKLQRRGPPGDSAEHGSPPP
jgi:hypothetical protein